MFPNAAPRAASPRRLLKPMVSTTASAFGVQADSTRLSTPSHGFQKMGRWDVGRHGLPVQYLSSRHLRTAMGVATPAPSRYNINGAVGNQPLSTRENASSVKFSLVDRWSLGESLMRLNATPGPAAYNH